MKGGITPDFYLPTEIFFRQGILSEAGPILKNLGSRALIVTTSSDLHKFGDIIDIVTNSISSSGLGFLIYDEIDDVPNTEYVDSATYFAKKSRCDIVLGLGSVNSINTARAVSVLANNFLFCEDLFDDPAVSPPLPLVTIPAYPLSGFELLPMFYLRDLTEPRKK
ncbi:MAG TPA: iron-containing alcohol dehydrogenase, partial [Spirochaetes bacterium]|nr:iron-containing alcohol dehydrogenase [Spirochaetota bacterium]